MDYKFEPINIKEDRIRLLCEHRNNTYTLHMGQGMLRQFTDETLPDEIKSLLGMINSFDWDKIHMFTDAYEEILWSAKPYFPSICNEIGWRVADRYALILPMSYFMELRGEVQS